MPPPLPPSSSTNGAGHNLFVEADPDLASLTQPGPAPARTVVPRRGRGLVIPVETPAVTDSTQPRQDDLVRFTRRTPRAVRLPSTTREYAIRGEANAQRLLGQVLARRYGALITLAVVAGLLLALSLVGLALGDTLGARQSTQRRQAAAAAALGHARAEIRTLSVQRDQAAAAARLAAVTAQRDQASTSTRQAPSASHSQRTQPHQHRH